MRAEVADHGAQRSRNEHAVAEVRLGSRAAVAGTRMAQSVCPQLRNSPSVAALTLRADSVAKVESCTATNFWRNLKTQSHRRFV
jgi:hypothetical protein